MDSGNKNKVKLGQLLIDAKLITAEQLNKALENQREWGGKLGSTLVNMGFIKEDKLSQFLSHQLNIPSIDIGSIRIKKETIDLISSELAEKYMLIPVAYQEQKGSKRILLAMSDPLDLNAIDAIQFATGMKVKAGIAPEGAIWRAIQIYYYGNETISAKIDAPAKSIKIDVSDIDEKLEIFRGRDEDKRTYEDMPLSDDISLKELAVEIRALRNLLVRNNIITVTEFFSEIKKLKG